MDQQQPKEGVVSDQKPGEVAKPPSRLDVVDHQDSNAHKTIDSQKSNDLQTKLQYYEREHEVHQNKLIAQRDSYETQIAALKKQLEDKSVKDSQPDANLGKALEDLKAENAKLKLQVTDLQTENQRLKLKGQVDALADGVVAKKAEDIAKSSLTSEHLQPLIQEALGKAEGDVNQENQKRAEVLSGLVQNAISRANSGIRAEDELDPVFNQLVGDTLSKAESHVKQENQKISEILSTLVQNAISRANSVIRAEEELDPIFSKLAGESLTKAETQVKQENQQISQVLGDLVDFALSRANSHIGHEQEVMGVADTLVGGIIAQATEEVNIEHQEITDTLNKVIGDAVIKAATGVQGEKNLRQELINMFSTVKLAATSPTIDQLEVLLIEAMTQAFLIVQKLHTYFKATPYLDSEKDMRLREKVLEAMTQAGYLMNRLDGGIRSPMVLEPASDFKATMNTQGTGDVDYQEKLSKLQRKIEKFEAYVEEKDRTILEQETQLNELQDQVHESIKIEENLRSQLKDKGKHLDDVSGQLKTIKDTHDRQLRDIQQSMKAKDASLQDAWQMASERELEISKITAQLREAEDIAREYQNRGVNAQRMQEALEECEQIKGDFLQIMNFKNELEILVEEQTQHIEMKNKKLQVMDETLRFKDGELEKKDSLLRKMSPAMDEMKKKLTQAEMKLRQITQTTLRDMKVKAKDQLNEIEVLKEMVKSATKAAKAKDIDIQRLTKKLQRLEKLIDGSKGMLIDGASAYQGDNQSMQGIPEEPEGETTNDGFAFRGAGNRGDPLGLNPANYANLEDEVQNDLLMAQQQRQFKQKTQRGGAVMPNIYNQSSIKNSKQKEIEEAIELDKMLELERRNASHEVFAKKYDEKFDNYFRDISAVPNLKNNSSSMQGIFGGPPDGNKSQLDDSRQYKGLLPNLNSYPNRREELEAELGLNDESQYGMRKGANNNNFMTPNVGTNAVKGKAQANYTPMMNAGKMISNNGSSNDVYGYGAGGNKYKPGGGQVASANKRFTMN